MAQMEPKMGPARVKPRPKPLFLTASFLGLMDFEIPSFFYPPSLATLPSPSSSLSLLSFPLDISLFDDLSLFLSVESLSFSLSSHLLSPSTYCLSIFLILAPKGILGPLHHNQRSHMILTSTLPNPSCLFLSLAPLEDQRTESPPMKALPCFSLNFSVGFDPSPQP